MNIDNLGIKIFADGADPVKAVQQSALSYINGFTTNPTLMRQAGIIDYRTWAEIMLECVNGKPISFEVLADEFPEMERQARTIASWGKNIYVKIPITNTKGQPSDPLIKRLSCDGVQVNVTAVMVARNIPFLAGLLSREIPSIVSIFAGRIADTGIDPAQIVALARNSLPPNVEVLWASTREIFNIKQAIDANCDIITVPDNLLAKLNLLGKDLKEFSRETVQQFYDDAIASQYIL